MRKLLLFLPAIAILLFAALRFVPGSQDDIAHGAQQSVRDHPKCPDISTLLIDSFGPDALNIEVGVEDNVAVLSGDVEERSTLDLAETVVESVDGIIVVHNFLNLRTIDVGTPDNAVDDKTLVSDLTEKLASRIGDFASDISIKTSGGVVLLRGVLPDIGTHDAAIRVAENLASSSRVIDLLHVAWTTSAGLPVSPASAPTSSTFEGDIMMAMEGEK